MARISLDRVWKRFGETAAVRDVNVEIEDGEFVVLVGPSGCGKSTTLRMIAGLEEVSEGSIRFDGVDVTSMTPRERNVAMVFQSYALYPHMNVFDNMAFTLRQRRVGKGEINRIVTQTAEMLNIGDLLGRRPKELSGGQRQRVAMGRAVVRQPRVFLFDEPLSNLDAALRSQMRIEIKRLHQKLGTTVVYVTHDQVEAMTLADRIVVMNAGEVVQVGDPMALYQRPTTKFAAGFIGSPKMNFIPCRVGEPARGKPCLQIAPEIDLPVPARLADVCARLAGREVEIGLRPEHLTDAASLNGHADGAVSFDAVVDVVEPMGADTHVIISVNGTEVTARCRPDAVCRVGEAMTFAVDLSGLCLIDSESGRVIHD